MCWEHPGTSSCSRGRTALVPWRVWCAVRQAVSDAGARHAITTGKHGAAVYDLGYG